MDDDDGVAPFVLSSALFSSSSVLLSPLTGSLSSALLSSALLSSSLLSSALLSSALLSSALLSSTLTSSATLSSALLSSTLSSSATLSSATLSSANYRTLLSTEFYWYDIEIKLNVRVRSKIVAFNDLILVIIIYLN